MAVTFFPFNSIVVDGVPDRPANAENLAAYLAGFFSNGVIMQEDTALKVEAYSGMSVHIRAGMGNINGKTILADAAEIITLDTASVSLNRIDRVVFRLDEVNRLMEFGVLTGTPASSPTAPALTQAADIYELCLAEIRVPAGATSIAASYITDTRADAELCGLASIAPHMQDLEHGGTEATTAEQARINLGVEPEYIQVSLSEVMSPIPTALTKVPFDVVTESNGKALTLKDNKIVIGAGIKAVKVSAHIKNNPSSAGGHSYGVALYHNGKNKQYFQTYVSSAAMSLGIPSMVIEVSEGDTIHIETNATLANTARITQAYFTVEKVV